MKLSINWIRDFAGIPAVLPAELLEKITLSICEVEEIIEWGKSLDKVLVAEILEKKSHPNSERLWVLSCNNGTETAQIVTSAANIEKGDLAAFIKPGFIFEDGTEIQNSKIQGVESEGMLCSEKELGFSDEHEGLMILPKTARVGQTLAKIFPDQVDLVCDIDNKSITHRPDLWAHYGFARELAAMFEIKLKPLHFPPEELSGPGETFIQTTVIDDERIPRFSAMSIDNVSVCKSLDFISRRLYRVGLRSINNLVDLTNYTMLEIGQPMHAFDPNRIVSKTLSVDFANDGEKFVHLQGQEIRLTNECLVFKDKDKPVSLAGIIGGMSSGIYEDTHRLYLEAANWDPVMIRKTSARHGIKTDASQRYEKGQDPELTLLSLYRSLHLLKQTCPDLQVAGPLLDIDRKKFLPKQIVLNLKKLNRILGAEPRPDFVEKTLTSIGFDVQKTTGGFMVSVPSWRRTKDIEIQEDLIEEIGRIYNYNRIKPQAPVFPIDVPQMNPRMDFVRLTKQVLSGSGFSEIFTYPITHRDEEEKFGIRNSEPMQIINPVNQMQDRMRCSIVPFLVKAAADSQKFDANFGLFEIGKIYRRAGNKSREISRLGLCYTSKLGSLEENFQQLKKQLYNLFARLRLPIPEAQSDKPDDLPVYTHPFCSGKVFAGGSELGYLFALHKSLHEEFSLKNYPFFADLNFDTMFALANQDYKARPLHRFPPMLFDFSLFLDRSVEYAEIEKEIQNFSPLISEVSFRDLFIPKDTPDKKSLTLRIIFRSSKKTLGHEEVQTLRDGLIKHLSKKGYSLR